MPNPDLDRAEPPPSKPWHSGQPSDVPLVSRANGVVVDRVFAGSVAGEAVDAAVLKLHAEPDAKPGGIAVHGVQQVQDELLAHKAGRHRRLHLRPAGWPSFCVFPISTDTLDDLEDPPTSWPRPSRSTPR